MSRISKETQEMIDQIKKEIVDGLEEYLKTFNEAWRKIDDGR